MKKKENKTNNLLLGYFVYQVPGTSDVNLKLRISFLVLQKPMKHIKSHIF